MELAFYLLKEIGVPVLSGILVAGIIKGVTWGVEILRKRNQNKQ